MKRSGVRRLFSLSLGRNWEREVEEEILTHLSIRAERLVALGMSPQAAKDEAIRRFGPLDESRAQMIEAARHREEFMKRRETLAELRQDVAFALRTLTRNKGWATVAVITLALGIAATTTVWSAATTVLLHPLSYPDADRIVNTNLMPTTGNSTGVDVAITPGRPLLDAWQRDARSFEALEPYASSLQVVGLGPSAEEVVVTRVQASFPTFAGERPLAGRFFTTAEVESNAPVAVLGEAHWRTQFGGSSSAIGQTVNIAQRPVRIIGVMPAALRTPRVGGRAPAFWMPAEKDRPGYRVIGRLREGVTPEAAARELDSIAVRARIYPQALLPFRAALTTPGQSVSFHDSLVMLAGAVATVLLVAVANVAHLLLARGLARRREVAIRSAMGASRGRIARQMMTESFILSVIGCALGAAVGFIALEALVKFRPPTLPELQLAHVDGVALGLVVAVSLLCALIFGTIAATAASTQRSAGALKAGAVSAHSRGGERFRSMLVVTEMALSAMLLVGAALLVRTVAELQQTDLGFNPRHLYSVVPELPESAGTPESRVAEVRRLAQVIREIPGVVDVSVTDAIPSYRNFAVGTLEIEGRPRPAEQGTSFTDVGSVTPAYFGTLGATLVEGRLPDSTTGSTEILINESYARKQWRGGSPIGHRVRVFYQGEENPWRTIVGVVRDISTMGPVGERGAPFLYLPLMNASAVGIVYRTDGREATVAQVVAVTKRELPTARVRQHDTERTIANSLAPSRFIMVLMAGFTLLALILAAVGLYGMMSYAVAQRTREIGIRMALGATRDAIARAVVGRGALLAAIGSSLGLVLAIWATRIIEGSLYGVSRLDAVSFAFGGVALVAIAVLACIVPMRRAVRVDPMTSIRAD